MKVLVVEDDLIAYDMASTFLREHGYHHIDHSVSVKEGIELLKKNPYHILFLDIHLTDGLGIDLIEYVPSQTHVIFMTVDPAYAVNAFEIEALDYLLKPITKSRFETALNKVETSPEERSIIIKADLQYHSVAVNSIKYITSNKDYLTLVHDEGSYTFFGRIKNFVEKLPADEFMQCHRSYIANLGRASGYSTTAIVIDEEEVPVSRRYKSEVAERFKELNNLE